MSRQLVRLCVVVLLAPVLAVGQLSYASTDLPRVVVEDPADYTPRAVRGYVMTMAASRGTVYAGGRISRVVWRGQTYTRRNVLAFKAATGRPTRLKIRTNGLVRVIVVARDRRSLYIGGEFTRVNGVRRVGLARVRLSGRVVRSFNARLNDRVTDAALTPWGPLMISGTFSRAGGKRRTALATVNPRSGNASRHSRVKVTGRTGRKAGETDVYRFDISGRHVAIIGNFAHLNGRPRTRLARLEFVRGRLVVPNWDSRLLHRPCNARHPSWTRDVEFSPNGAFFAVVTTGGPRPGLCDSASRWETRHRGRRVRPTWVNKTGGDTLLSVAVTSRAVYVGGHQRRLEQDGRPVPRPGIGAIAPRSGSALNWNPTRSRGIGAQELTVVRSPRSAAGLWVGSDGPLLGGERHDGIGFLPLRR